VRYLFEATDPKAADAGISGLSFAKCSLPTERFLPGLDADGARRRRLLCRAYAGWRSPVSISYGSLPDIPASKTADDRRTRIMKMVRFISHVRVSHGGFGSIFDAREVSRPLLSC
jgi:hypothetical protein